MKNNIIAIATRFNMTLSQAVDLVFDVWEGNCDSFEVEELAEIAGVSKEELIESANYSTRYLTALEANAGHSL